MASFISGMTDVNANSTLFTPDYNFLRYTLDKRTQNYEQGLSQVSSAYNFLNSELSSPINSKRRDEYLKNAQNQLKQISMSDLSQQQNVEAANNVFAPMATDKAFLYDATATAANKKELAQMEEWRNSPDIEQRKKFNQELYDLVSSDLDGIKNDKTGDISKYNYKGRKAVAYFDPEELIEKEAKAQGFKVVTETDGGKYIYKITDGPDSRQNYKDFANTVLRGNNVFQNQNWMLAEARDNNLLKQAKLVPENAGKTDDQIRKEFGIKTFNANRASNKTVLNSYAKAAEDAAADYTSYATANQALISTKGPGYEDALQILNDKAQKAKASQSQYDVNKGNFETNFGGKDLDEKSEDLSKKREEYGNKFITDSKNIFYNQYFDDAIERFADIKASGGSKEILENKAYFESYKMLNESQKILNDRLDKLEKDQLKEQEIGIKDREETRKENKDADALARAGIKGTGTKGSKSGEQEVTYVGISGTEISKTEVLQRLKTETNNALSQANSLLMNQNGGVLNILPEWGIDEKYVPILRDAFSKMYAPHQGNIKWNQKDIDAMNAMVQGMLKWGENTNNKELVKEIRDEMSDKTKGAAGYKFTKLLDLGISGMKIDDKTMQHLPYINQIQEFKKHMATVDANSALIMAGEKAFVQSITKDKNSDFKKLLNDDKTGIIDKSTVTGWFKNKKKNIESMNPGLELTDDIIDKLSDGYINNTLKLDNANGQDLTLGKLHMILPSSGSASYYGEGVYLNNKEKDDVGNSVLKILPDEFAKLKKKADENLIIPGKEIEQLRQNAAQASSIFNLGGNSKKEMGTLLSSVTQHSSQLLTKGESGTYPPVESDEVREKIRTLINDPANIQSMKVFPLHTSNNGLAVEVTISEKDKKDGDKLNANGTYVFPINVGDRTPEALKIFNIGDKLDEYRRLSNNGITEPQTIHDYSGMGVRIKIQPDGSNSNTGNLIVERQVIDPTTGKYKEEFERLPKNDNFNQRYDLNNINFNDLNDLLYNNYVIPFVQERAKYQQQQNKTINAGGSGSITIPKIVFKP